MELKVPRRRFTWRPCWRIIPSRFVPIELFERVTRPEDLEATYQLESITNDRLRQETGDLTLVALEDRVSGPGSSVIMAAFTHPNPMGSRFSDGTFGVLYAAREFDTAVAETIFHREEFMRATREPAMELDMRAYVLDLRGALHDIRRMREGLPDVYDPDT